MKIKCLITESSYEITERKLSVESCGPFPFNSDVYLTIDDKRIKVDADELIKAVQNCKNC